MWPISNGCSWSCDAKSPKKTKERYVKTRDACEKWIFPNIGFMRWIPIGVIFLRRLCSAYLYVGHSKKVIYWSGHKVPIWPAIFPSLSHVCIGFSLCKPKQSGILGSSGSSLRSKSRLYGGGEVEKKINRAKMRAFVGLQRSVQAKASFMVWRAICVLSTQITLLCLAYNESCSGWKMAANFDLFLESSWSLALSIVIWSCSGHNSRSEAITL